MSTIVINTRASFATVILATLCAFAPSAHAAFYVSNGGDGTIKMVTSAGAVSTYATGLITPRGLAFDSANSLYVINNGDSSIKIIPAGGGSASTYIDPTKLGNPGQYDFYGLAIDAGNLYLSAIDISGNGSNANNSVIFKIDIATKTVSTFATVPNPGGLVFDNNHNLFVTNAIDSVTLGAIGGINEVSPLGVVTPIVSTGMDDPIGLARAANGDLYAADRAGSMQILHATLGGSFNVFTAGVTSPYGLAFGTDGLLYAADFADGQLDVVSAGGTATPFATGLSSPRFITLGPDIQAPEPATLPLLIAGTLLLRKRANAGTR